MPPRRATDCKGPPIVNADHGAKKIARINNTSNLENAIRHVGVVGRPKMCQLKSYIILPKYCWSYNMRTLLYICYNLTSLLNGINSSRRAADVLTKAVCSCLSSAAAVVRRSFSRCRRVVVCRCPCRRPPHGGFDLLATEFPDFLPHCHIVPTPYTRHTLNIRLPALLLLPLLMRTQQSVAGVPPLT